jgi:hypothetical protein
MHLQVALIEKIVDLRASVLEVLMKEKHGFL